MNEQRRKTVLVTGANGYIGTRLILALGERGYRILAVVRNKNRLRDDLVELLGDQLCIIEADFSSSELPNNIVLWESRTRHPKPASPPL